MKIDIDTRTFVRFWLVLVGLALAAAIIYQVRVALIIIGAALFLSVVLSPSVNYLASKLPSKSRVLGTAIAYIFVVLALGLIILLVVPPVVEQMVKFIQNVPSLIDAAGKQYAGLNNFINSYHLQPEFVQITNSIKDGATQFASNIGSFLVGGISSAFSVVTAAILLLFMSFLMLVEAPTWLNKLWSAYKNRAQMQHHRKLLGQMYNVVTSYVTGQLTVSAIAGGVAGVLVLVLSLVFNIPSNLTVPSLTIVFVMSLIPLFGEITGALLVCLILALNSITAAIAFIVFFIIYAQIEANFISPKIQSKRIDLSALIILIAVTIGVYLFGAIGGIISIPVAGCIRILVDDYFEHAKN
jgi:predicted PurR-regulated permease PerM